MKPRLGTLKSMKKAKHAADIILAESGAVRVSSIEALHNALADANHNRSHELRSRLLNGTVTFNYEEIIAVAEDVLDL